jgi:RNA polymerase sigma-70 factor (ECF subfamily)
VQRHSLPGLPASAAVASPSEAAEAEAAVRGGTGLGESPPAQPPTTGQPQDDDRGLTFEQIHRKYETKIFNLILRIVGDFDDAQDLTVDTFVNAFRAWDRFRGDSRIYTWLYQIAVNNCKNRFKQRDRRREREPVSLDDSIETDSGELSREVADWSNSPERMLLDQEFADRLRRAVDALRPEYRVVFVLVEMEGLSYEDSARVTGLTVPAVKTRLHRARNMIRQRLEPYYRG